MTLWRPLLAGTVLLLGLGACGKPVPADVLVCGHPKTHAVRSQQDEVHAFAQCGPSLDFTPVNEYRGEFSDVLGAEDAVALIDGRCTGTLIQASAGPVLLTAGHCVGLDDRVLAVFNFEDAPDGEELVVEGTVFERSDAPDYALIRLDVRPQATPVPLTAHATDALAVIQHPRGQRKVVAEGRRAAACDGLVYYAELDTLVSSSGAGVLTAQGHLLGVHTDGDCDRLGRGTNYGWTAEAVVAASPYLQPEDLVAE